MGKTVAELKADFEEERYRLIKRNNLIVFGIEENEGGEEILRKLVQILRPGGGFTIDQERVGAEGKNDKPRPVRLILPNAIVKRNMMANLKNLKNKEEFKSIQVVQDLTRNQQKVRSAEYMKSKMEAGTGERGNRAKRVKLDAQPSSSRASNGSADMETDQQ
ncbi:unnamed protein product [Orchesella dallaii]|uniref:Uncharacterized protein n=1 Tax=Orchesella dallaii TaxID=48710 RepID=A0ABP1RJP6_9HEXA